MLKLRQLPKTLKHSTKFEKEEEETSDDLEERDSLNNNTMLTARHLIRDHENWENCGGIVNNKEGIRVVKEARGTHRRRRRRRCCCCFRRCRNDNRVALMMAMIMMIMMVAIKLKSRGSDDGSVSDGGDGSGSGSGDDA